MGEVTMGWMDYLSSIYEAKKQPEVEPEKKKGSKKKVVEEPEAEVPVEEPKSKFDPKKVVAENDEYAILKVSSLKEMEQYIPGTLWHTMFETPDSVGSLREKQKKWDEFSKGGAFVAIKKKLGKIEPRRYEGGSRYAKMKLYPYSDKFLVALDTEKNPTFWNTGMFESKAVPAGFPEFFKVDEGGSDVPTPEVDNWIERDDGMVDVVGDLVIDDGMLDNGMLPWRFNRINGNFSLAKCKTLVSYSGCPEVVYGNFVCANNSKIKNLLGCPEFVEGNFDATGHTSLISLNGSPRKIVGKFVVARCDGLVQFNSTTIEAGSFICSYCKNLEKFVGGPWKVHRDIIAVGCPKLWSLKGMDTRPGGKIDFTGCLNLSWESFWRVFTFIPHNIIYPKKIVNTDGFREKLNKFFAGKYLQEKVLNRHK